MKKMFIFVAIAGLAFASCKKDDLVAPESAKNAISNSTDKWVKNSKKIVEYEGANYIEYTNLASGQVVYCEISESNSKEAKYDRKSEYVAVPGETWKRLECNDPGDDCLNKAVIGPGGSVYLEPYLKNEMK